MADTSNRGVAAVTEAQRPVTHIRRPVLDQARTMQRSRSISMSRSAVTPLGAFARGLAAGLVGTAAMAAYQKFVSWTKRCRSGDSSDSGLAQQTDWSQAPAPAQVAKRLIESLFQPEVAPDRIPFLTYAMYWGYGMEWGGIYGIVQGTVEDHPVRYGLIFGSGYGGCPTSYSCRWDSASRRGLARRSRLPPTCSDGIGEGLSTRLDLVEGREDRPASRLAAPVRG